MSQEQMLSGEVYYPAPEVEAGCSPTADPGGFSGELRSSGVLSRQEVIPSKAIHANIPPVSILESVVIRKLMLLNRFVMAKSSIQYP